MTELNKLNMKTLDGISENIEKIEKLFPNCITESKDQNGNLKKSINFDVLKQLLSKDIAEGREYYEFTWPGKKAAILEANAPITKTLRPCVEDGKDWQNTKNLYIEGDNLEALKILQESYLGKVKMIYIDPPYNTGNDFVYKDDFKKTYGDYSESIEQYGEGGYRLFKNTESNGRFHSDWCTMLYPRLLLARSLLKENGAILVSIDDNEQANIKKILDEVFGENNKVAELIVIRSEGGGRAKQVVKGHDYLFVYAKNVNKFTPLGKPKDIRGKIVERNGEKYWIQEDWLRKNYGQYGNCYYEDVLKYKGQSKLDEINQGLNKGEYVLLEKDNGKHLVGKLRNLKVDFSKFYSLVKFLSAEGVEDLKKLELDGVFSYPKPVSLLNSLVLAMTMFSIKESEIVLDFFSGSATTAHAVMQLNAEDGGNRQFIMVQLPESCAWNSEAFKARYKNICEIGKERIRRAGEQIKKDHPESKVDVGFRVFKVDSSNMKDVYYNPESLSQDLLLSLESNVKEDRTDYDLLFSTILDLGLTLDKEVKEETIGNTKVYIYNDDEKEGPDLIACFAESITEDVITAIAKRNPLKAVFKDSSFENSPSKINLFELFKTYANISDDNELQSRVRVI